MSQKKSSHEKESPESLDIKEVDSGLKAIYGDGSETDFSRLERRTRSFSGFLGKLVIFLGSLTVISWGLYLAYFQLFAEDRNVGSLQTELFVSERAASGGRDRISFSYHNDQRIPLANFSVRAQIPDSFQLLEATPPLVDPDTYEWNLGALDASTSGEISLEGIWVADIPSVQPVQFITTYRPSNFNADFSDVDSAQVPLEESLVTLQLEGPDVLSAGEDGTFTLFLENTSEEELPAGEITLTLPEGFFLESASPEFDETLPYSWEFPSLPAEGASEFSFTGTMSSGAGGFTPFTATLFFVENDTSFLQATETSTVDVPAGDITFRVSVNGSSSQISAAPGDQMNATIIIENTTDATISDASVLLDFRAEAGMPIDWSRFDYDGGTLTPDGVLWSSSLVGDIDPGERVVFTPSFPLRNPLRSNDSTRLDFLVRLLRNDSDLPSDVYRVYIGDQASVLGELSSDNELSLTITPPPQPLEDILLSIALPDGAALSESAVTPVGSSALLASTNEWKWRIPQIPAGSNALRTSLRLDNLPDDWDGVIELRAIDPNTLEELFLESSITRLDE